MKCNDLLLSKVPNVIAAACVMHNMCEIHGEAFDESWSSDTSEDLSQPESPILTTAHSRSTSVRESLIHYFSNDH